MRRPADKARNTGYSDRNSDERRSATRFSRDHRRPSPHRENWAAWVSSQVVWPGCIAGRENWAAWVSPPAVRASGCSGKRHGALRGDESRRGFLNRTGALDTGFGTPERPSRRRSEGFVTGTRGSPLRTAVGRTPRTRAHPLRLLQDMHGNAPRPPRAPETTRIQETPVPPQTRGARPLSQQTKEKTSQ